MLLYLLSRHSDHVECQLYSKVGKTQVGKLCHLVLHVVDGAKEDENEQ